MSALKDKVIVVTGASAGIGRAFAELAHKGGAHLVVAARREKELAELARAIGAVAVIADVTKRADLEHIAAAAIEKHGRIDVWINNAGQGITRMPSQVDDDDVDEMMRVNFKSALYGMQAALAHMKPKNAGHIINISTMLARVPFTPIRSMYAASKAALDSFSAQLRLELYESHPGIAVTSFHPGVVTTDFGLNARHGGHDNRALPNSQTADQVASSLALVIESRAVDAYSQPFFRKMAADYLGAEDMSAVERGMLRR
jgi:NADP-dependent 3-hydroxy acid dehydrogenase YdfG